jgi:TetR/AcrR family transcriptional regulator, mexJK operon transcriptional repressor
MKDWSDDHPKAKLMARKRAAILDAAGDAFLRLGYEGASMEGIAAAAGVSIMTLYRHAESKEDLFQAVISSACDPSNEAEKAKLAEVLQRPLGDVLEFVGVMFQERLASPQTIALFRVVMVESSRFPQLAEMAYRGFVADHEDTLDAFLAQRPEAKGASTARRRRLSATFINHLVGADILRALLGLEGASADERRRRARYAADELLAGLPASSA